MTWTEVSQETTTFTLAADMSNGYVAIGYVENDYVDERIWTEVTETSTSWA